MGKHLEVFQVFQHVPKANSTHDWMQLQFVSCETGTAHNTKGGGAKKTLNPGNPEPGNPKTWKFRGPESTAEQRAELQRQVDRPQT